MKTRSMVKGLRPASKAAGDDVTLSRFVKTGKSKPRAFQIAIPDIRNGAIDKGRSIFHKKGVKPPGDKPLVSGHNSAKIGRDVRKGKLFRGYYIFSLTLEERATCPRSCFHWQTCYGNNMPFARRSDHSDPDKLMQAVRSQLDQELTSGRRKGILVRLHMLGDFFSVEYVRFWNDLLDHYPRLAVFGYTAWKPWDEIGQAIDAVALKHGPRFAIRWSDGFGADNCAITVMHEKDAPANSFVCPEQTGKTRACATCGLCWNTRKNVTFIHH